MKKIAGYPLSRRSFLKGSAAMGISVALAPGMVWERKRRT